MRPRAILSALLLVITASPASPAFASFGGGGGGGGSAPPPAPPPSSQTQTPPSEKSSARGEAEKLYAQAYEEIGRAKQDVSDGKVKNAEKRFKKALGWGEQATDLDPEYHEAWNLVGYSARKLGDYDKAFAAYDKCLAIKSDYAPAREYLGEAWLEKGDAKKAREQLVLLQKFGATDDAKTLQTAIDAYESAHPELAKADTTASQ